jgi:alpha-beta hydrolase superfamily lysophospholipase
MNAPSGRLLALSVVLAALSSSSAFGQCEPLVVRYDGSNWWWGAFGGCKRPGGPTGRDAIFECAWNQIPVAERLSCLKERLSQTEQTRQAIDDVAAANGPANSCDRLMVKYDRSNWWWGAFGHCKQNGGITDRTAIFECAWNQVPNADKTSCLKDRLRQTEFTRQGIDSVAADNGPPANCDQLMRKYDGSRWWDGAFGNCKKAGGAADREGIFDCAWVQVPPPDNQACLKERLRQTEQTRKDVDDVAAANGAVRSRYSTVAFNDCADPTTGCPEACDLPADGSVPGQYFANQTPVELLDLPVSADELMKGRIGTNEGRLTADLRAVARLADPVTCSLPLSAIHNALGNVTMARALADLSVTGRRAFAAFKKRRPDEKYCRKLPTLAASCPAPTAMPTTKALLKGCEATLNRAYEVANFLRTGESTVTNPNKIAERNALGWIAVSGEDDAPHRPVNVPSSDFLQYDIDVNVEAPLAQPPGTVTVSSRFTLAQFKQPALPPVVKRPGWKLRPEPRPAIGPDAEILIFVHGMDSRAEEANDITKALFSVMRGNAGRPSPKNLVVIAVDLPTSGYATNLDYDRVSPLSLIGSPKVTVVPVPIVFPPEIYGAIAPLFIGFGLPLPPPGVSPITAFPDFAASGRTPLLDFIETFVVRFVDAVDAQTPIKNNVQAVIGGSLGGNLSFRLGRRAEVPWLPAAVVWSPASIWDSLGEGPAPAEPWNVVKHFGPLGAWLKANDRDPNDPSDLSPGRASKRQAFFVDSWDKAVVPLLVTTPQSETWFSDSWPCKKSAVLAGRLDRQETYDARFQSWHWRLGAEQLLYSHQTPEAAARGPRYLANYKPMLLACGTEDEVPFNNICSATQKTAQRMTMTPGKAIFMQKTGHSLDNERREFFAKEVVEFLGLR